MVSDPRVSRRFRRIGVASLALLACAAAWLVFSPTGTPTAIRPGWSILRPPDDVNALVLHRGRLIAGGRDGLVAIDPATAATMALPGAASLPPTSYVKALLVDRTGRLWVGHRGGLLRWDGTAWRVFAVDPGTAPGPVSALIETAGGEILVGGEAGLATVGESGFVAVALPAGGAGSAVSALHEDRQGRLWVGFASAGRGGLLVRDGGNWRVFGLADGLAHLSINAISEDRSGRIHLATGFSGRGGACRQATAERSSRWLCIGAAEGLASDMVRLVFEDGQGQVWYGSEFEGMAVAQGGTLRRLGRADGQAGTELKAMLEDPAGNLWLGCDKGLTRITAAAALIE